MQGAKCSVKRSQAWLSCPLALKRPPPPQQTRTGRTSKTFWSRSEGGAEGFPTCNRRNMRTERGVMRKRELLVGAVSLPGRWRRGCNQKGVGANAKLVNPWWRAANTRTSSPLKPTTISINSLAGPELISHRRPKFCRFSSQIQAGLSPKPCSPFPHRAAQKFFMLKL